MAGKIAKTGIKLASNPTKGALSLSKVASFI
jgi:hypothetical protein